MKAVQLDPGFARGYQRAAKAFLTMGKLEQVKPACSQSVSEAVCVEGKAQLQIVL